MGTSMVAPEIRSHIESAGHSRRKVCATAVLVLSGAAFCGCNMKPQPPSDQQIQQQAAKTTEQVRAGAKVAAADAKVAAANAARKLNDIAAGVRQGMHDGSAADDRSAPESKTNGGRIDLNRASLDDLATLPGVSGVKAQAIIDGRPYGSSHDLVSRGLLSESHYERIARRITAR